MKNVFGHFGLMVLCVTCFVTCPTTSTSVVLQPQIAKQGQAVNGWRIFTTPDKSFSVELPCEPTQTNVSAPSTPIYEYSCMIKDKDDLFFFTASAADIGDREKAGMQDAANFDRTIKELFPPHKRIIRIMRLKIENGIGRDFIVTNPKDEMDNLRGRMILIGRRQYWIVFGSTDLTELDSANAERFFASFKPLQ